MADVGPGLRRDDKMIGAFLSRAFVREFIYPRLFLAASLTAAMISG